ncbi:hypothetical protein CGRA01v4_10654 [Colletotrichum graminicola]|uniref:Integral membrane protein n=1 Tax=Colletotrichum graminicola (strain M1.001 / M2 / FGSC 10212) TaxID=645133 RepID=E3QKF5_COLGM|nr:uncharacterized protein GLRG_06487 [Colletotrichum graminicola M1.001]EFQ31343.1 hypothetical protein GLRG_06487 [Colletotrichum graminicola M1.001]WDK19367.1 hypothetical protein CGRA01v4_10654 [Colletotrichum graminicola]
MSHRPPTSNPARSSRPQPVTKSGSVPKATSDTLAAPKPVRPISATLQPPTAQWTGNPSPSSYTSFNVPPPGSPAPNANGPSAPPKMPASSPGSSAADRLSQLRSPGPGAITSFPPPPPTPPQREATCQLPKGTAQPPKKTSTSATNTAARAQASVANGVWTPPENATSPVEAAAGAKQRPGVIDLDNLEETLQNLRFAPSPMLSTIYSVPSTPGDEISTPDFPTSHRSSCFTPPSANPTPEPITPVDATPRGPLPMIKEPIMSPTRPRANSRRASPPSRKRGRGVVACINSPATFCTTWYTHPTAPDFPICSRCYEDYLVGTRFEHDFRGKVCDDNKPRVCRFSKPRIRDHILRNTLATGRIEDLVSFLGHRSTIPDCRGLDGVMGGQGAKWFRPKNNAVPNMVVCQACFEDHIQPYRFAANFEPASGQAPTDVWSCDLSTPYIQKVYKTAAAENDWAGFTKEAVARMTMPACAKRQKVTVGSRRWFTPAATAAGGVLICAACYHDHIVGSGEERNWRDAGRDNLASRYGSLVYCMLGHFNVGVAMSRAAETGEFSVFWGALDAACNEDFCSPQGIKDGKWYTFPSHPEEFSICASCVATIAEPLGLSSSLVTKCGVSPGTTILCSFNPASPRFASYMGKLLEGFFTADTQPLESYALEFASLPLCPRDEDFQNRRWYGWKDCAVCPSCYHEFVRGTALAASMPLKGDMVPSSLMCEMYSPRMRGLYADACARSPPDPSELLKACKARRAVYAETVPAIREMIMEAQAALGQQRMLSTMGSANGGGAMGQIQDVARQNAAACGMPAVGFGFSNHFEMQGASYGKQANSILAESGTRALVIKQLERKWREVE